MGCLWQSVLLCMIVSLVLFLFPVGDIAEVFDKKEQCRINNDKNGDSYDEKLFQMYLAVGKIGISASYKKCYGKAGKTMERYAEYAFPVEYGE